MKNEENIITEQTEQKENNEVSAGKLILAIVIDYLKLLVPVFIIVYLLIFVIFNLTIIVGSSMSPTLEDGDVAIFNHISPNIERGNIIACYSSGADENIVKRVIGLEGDEIDLRDGNVYVNGELLEEDYTDGSYTETEGTEFPLTVPEGYIFVLGDNRDGSSDSRSPWIGLIAVDDVLGSYLFHIPMPF